VHQVEALDLVGEFDSANSAVQHMQNNHVDLIFLDIEMPGMNGVEFLEQFKPKSKIIFISPIYIKNIFGKNPVKLKIPQYLKINFLENFGTIPPLY
jgi:two-component SAPR family response regulator